jgi:hypothetical protein
MPPWSAQEEGFFAQLVRLEKLMLAVSQDVGVPVLAFKVAVFASTSSVFSNFRFCKLSLWFVFTQYSHVFWPKFMTVPVACHFLVSGCCTQT